LEKPPAACQAPSPLKNVPDEAVPVADIFATVTSPSPILAVVTAESASLAVVTLASVS